MIRPFGTTSMAVHRLARVRARLGASVRLFMIASASVLAAHCTELRESPATVEAGILADAAADPAGPHDGGHRPVATDGASRGPDGPDGTPAEPRDSGRAPEPDAGCTLARPCDAPPPSECVASDTRRFYAAEGECAAGRCSYAHVDLPCPQCPDCDDRCFIDTDGDALPEVHEDGTVAADDSCQVCVPGDHASAWSPRRCEQASNVCVEREGTCSADGSSSDCNDERCCRHAPVWSGTGAQPVCPLPGEDDGDLIESAVERWTGSCSAEGTCVACEAAADCGADFCVCGNATCTVHLCSAAACECQYDEDGDGDCDGFVARGLPDSAASCAAETCNGAGECLEALGARCSADAECTSGHCVDGVCCAGACSGTCERCNAAGMAGQCVADDALCQGGCAECTRSGERFECTPNAAACTGNCDVCTGSGTRFDCTPNAAACTGNCDVCTGSGTRFDCAADDSLCAGDCGACTGGATSFSCAADPSRCDACERCTIDGPRFTCEQSRVTDVVQERADDFTLVPPWQSFTVRTAGRLSAIEARPNVFGGATGELRVYAGTGTSGTLLRSQAYTRPSQELAPWQRFELVSPLPVTAGQVLTWELTGAGGIYYAAADVYAGGRSSVETHDMTMRIDVTPCP